MLFNEADYDGYRQKLRDLNWDLGDKDINEQIDHVTNNIFKAAEETIPNKTVTIRTRDLPWINNQIRKQIRQRNRLHNQAKRTNLSDHWKLFRETRNNVILLIRNSKVNHYKKLASNLHQGNLSSKQWWKLAKQFLNCKSDSDIPILNHDNNQYTSPEDKANIFNTFFTAQSNVDDSHASLPPDQPTSFSLDSINISTEDVRDVLKLLDPGKACGPDLINPRLLKEGADILSEKLCPIFNNSLSSSRFPDSWKLANVIPVFKKDDKTKVNNYRPISLLSCLGKVFEKCIFKHIFNFLIENQILTNLQSGFIPGDSAAFQLLDIYNTFTKAIDDGKEIRVIFCDISKAFDRV